MFFCFFKRVDDWLRLYVISQSEKSSNDLFFKFTKNESGLIPKKVFIDEFGREILNHRDLAILILKRINADEIGDISKADFDKVVKICNAIKLLVMIDTDDNSE